MMTGEQTPSTFAVAHEAEGEALALRLYGELDIAAIPRVEAAFQEAIARAPAQVVIDLAGLTFMDSSGLRFLLRAQARCTTEARELRIRSGAGVERILAVTRLDEVLPLER